ncbi:MAG: F0F1 ATP synthase subunit delta [Candidatus Saccharimonadales bacterium]
MAGARLSRRKIAVYCADELLDGNDVTELLAAYLIETKHIREAGVIVRDIEAALADRGTLIANITGGHELQDDTEKAILTYLEKRTGANTIHLRKQTDSHLLGGVRIETPGYQLDNTLRDRLNQLTASKI